MTTRNEETRRAGNFGERQPNGSIKQRHIYGLSGCNSTSSSRIAEQQRCRDYWSRMYGADAEKRSRGGVAWLR